MHQPADHHPLSSQSELLRERLAQEQQRSSRLATELEESLRMLGHYRQAVDNSPNAIFSIDPMGHIRSWNPACTEVFQYDTSILGHFVGRLLDDRDQLAFIQGEILQAPLAKTFTGLDLAYRCRDGSRKEMVSRIYPVRSNNNELDGFVFANTDVTERNKIHRKLDRYRHQLEELVEQRTTKLKEEINQRIATQQALQASHDALRTILDSLDLGIRVITVDQRECIFRNNRLKDMLASQDGHLSDDQLFSQLAMPLSPPTPELLASNGEPFPHSRSLEWLAPLGNRWFLLDERQIHWVDGRLVYLQVASDITERKQLEGDRLRIEKLESLGVLAGGIAHDFNNMLAGITGSLSLLQHQQAESAGATLLEAALKAATRATALTQQLLTFSKGGEPVKKVVAVDVLLQEAISFSLAGSAVKWTLDLDEPLYCVDADSGQLTQVFHNLALNAKQAMPAGGNLHVSAKNRQENGANGASVLPAGKYLQLDFCDNGPGIPKNILDKVFDPYFTTKSQGEGLGLAMAHRIITKHRGKLFAEPNADRGITFRIVLPATECALFEAEQAVAATRPVAARILLMDDDETIRQVGQLILRHLGYQATAVPDGESLLAVFRESMEKNLPFDALILDLTIPGGMGGEEVAQLLNRDHPGLKIIASSGYSDSPTMADYHQYGFAAILKKPYEVREMAEVLQRLLGSVPEHDKDRPETGQEGEDRH